MRRSDARHRLLLMVLLPLVAAGWLLWKAHASAASPRPNIVLFVADDLGWNDVGAYGNPGVNTPMIDALAARGMLFSNAFLTTSSCSPSRATMVTGRYPHNTGAMHLHEPLPRAANPLLPDLLRQAGYYTASIGKWHLGGDAARAFDRVLVDRGDTSGADHWLDALRARPRDKPFFFMLASHDPHPPFDSAALPERHSEAAVTVPPYLVDTPATRAEFAAYYDEIGRLDGHVGEVMEELRRQRVADNTLVVFLSDNGRSFVRAKTTLYDSGIKTPFILVWPGRVPAGSVNVQLVSSVDLAPTLLAAAGVPVPASMQGVSLLPTLRDPRIPVRDAIYAEHNWHGRDAHERAVRSLDYLYIENQWPPQGECRQGLFAGMASFEDLRAAREAGLRSPWLDNCFARRRARRELYDVRRDPFSLHNLAADPAYGATLRAYRQRLQFWRNLTGDRDFAPYEPPAKTLPESVQPRV